ncbi:MAG TPA: hypothetical protein VF247_10415 [Candidatus Krumholzibacteria bacterium]
MTTTTETLYYVLREGSTREEQWTWSDIEALCHSGELTGRARIFLPDEERWATIEETRLAGSVAPTAPAKDPAEDEHRASVEEEYKAALERIAEDPDLIEAQLDAGVLAAELGRRDDARTHFQTVLHRFPYHARTAQEVHRRFSKTEARTFRYLDRPAPVWEDLGEMVRMPFARGPLYVAIPAAVLAAFAWVPGGAFVAGALMFLWAFQAMEYTARGATKPPEWNRSFADPVRKLARPAALMAAVVAQWAVLVLGAAWIAYRMKGIEGVSLWGFASGSPVMLVLASLLAVLYLPAAMVSIGGFTGSIARTLDPRHLGRTIVRMEHEYVYTVFVLAAIGVALGVVRLITGVVPVAGPIVFGTALACATPMAGLVLGRLLGRMGHVIE